MSKLFLLLIKKSKANCNIIVLQNQIIFLLPEITLLKVKTFSSRSQQTLRRVDFLFDPMLIKIPSDGITFCK